MKIAVFTDSFSPLVNGVVTHILTTTDYLAQSNEIMIFAPKPADEKMKQIPRLSPNITTEYLTSLPAFIYKDARVGLSFLPVLFSKINDFQPDIIHFHSPMTVGLNGIMAAKILKKPLVGTFHTYFMEPEYLRIAHLDKLGLDENRLVNSLLWKYSNFYYNQADVVTCPSQTTKEDLMKHGITQPIKVISNGVVLNHKGVKKTTKLKLPRKKYFLYIGRISVEKSLEILIQAFQSFVQSNKEVDLVIVGDGPAKNQLKNLTKKLQLSQRIFFLGRIEHQQLLHSNIYNQALAFVTASKSETQCISVLEAMSQGLPVVGVNSRALPELIKGNGIICQPDNIQAIAQALSLLASDRKKQSQFSQKSFQIAQRHSLEQTVKELEAVYQELVAARL